ncbi:protein DOWN-REGULATED IN DIF1 11-like [Raphanus sativus]|uniref:Protein DOWN-REGULATED IN DIF1 11-like n=1 Tax=Raphanus sativus TaxID=3726 RepID=A0A9W3BR69_RAPSA|nr:protein DOWN-REGULATED IN DIF1 11-like [Raphanus sativus]
MELKTIFMAFVIITTLVSFSYPSFGQEYVDEEPLVNPGPEMDAVKSISPASQDYNLYMLENLTPKVTTFLENCMDKMGPSFKKCNEDVTEEILTKNPISRECCMKVVQSGKECYMEVIKLMFRFYQLKRFASQVSFRTNEVWDRCSAEVESPSSSHDGKIVLS